MRNIVKNVRKSARLALFGFSVTTIAATTVVSVGAPMRLWYNKPAAQWDEALPVGNGRLGAMVYGGVLRRKGKP
jgi:alpha-L-fucosidase 2